MKLLNVKTGLVEEVDQSAAPLLIENGDYAPVDEQANVQFKTGESGTVPTGQVNELSQRGVIAPELPEDTHERVLQRDYGDRPAAAFLEGAASVPTFGLSDELIPALGIDTEEGIRETAARNPFARSAGTFVGAVPLMAVPGVGELAEGVEAASAAAGAGAIGRAAAREAVVGGLMGIGQGIDENILSSDPNLDGQAMAANVLKGGFFGAALGAGAGAAFEGASKLLPRFGRSAENAVGNLPEGSDVRAAFEEPVGAKNDPLHKFLASEEGDPAMRLIREPDKLGQEYIEQNVRPLREMYHDQVLKNKVDLDTAENELISSKNAVIDAQDTYDRVVIDPKIEKEGYTAEPKSYEPSFDGGGPTHSMTLRDPEGKNIGAVKTDPLETITDVNGVTRRVYPVSTGIIFKGEYTGFGQELYEKLANYLESLPEAQRGTLISKASGRISEYSENLWKALARKGRAIEERYVVGLDPESAVTDVFLPSKGSEVNIDYHNLGELVDKGNAEQMRLLQRRLRSHGMSELADQVHIDDTIRVREKGPRPASPMPGQRLGPEPGVDKFWRFIPEPAGQSEKLAAAVKQAESRAAQAEQKLRFQKGYEKQFTETFKKYQQKWGSPDITADAKFKPDEDLMKRLFKQKSKVSELRELVKDTRDLNELLKMRIDEPVAIDTRTEAAAKGLIADRLFEGHGTREDVKQLGKTWGIPGVGNVSVRSDLGLAGAAMAAGHALGGTFNVVGAVAGGRALYDAGKQILERMANPMFWLKRSVRGADLTLTRISRLAKALVHGAEAETVQKLVQKSRSASSARDNETQRQAFKRRSDRAIAVATDPNAARKLSAVLAPYAAVSPQRTAAATKAMVDGQKYLVSKLPKAPDDQSLSAKLSGQPRQVSDFDVAKWNSIYAAIKDPVSTALAGALDGSLTKDQTEAIKAVYPDLYAWMQQRVLDEVATMQRTMPYQQRLKLGYLLEVQTDPSMDPQTMLAMQVAGATQEDGSSASQGQGAQASKNISELYAPPGPGASGRAT